MYGLHLLPLLSLYSSVSSPHPLLVFPLIFLHFFLLLFFYFFYFFYFFSYVSPYCMYYCEGARSETSTRVRKGDGSDTEGVRYIILPPLSLLPPSPPLLLLPFLHLLLSLYQWTKSSWCSRPHLSTGLPGLLCRIHTPSRRLSCFHGTPGA